MEQLLGWPSYVAVGIAADIEMNPKLRFEETSPLPHSVVLTGISWGQLRR